VLQRAADGGAYLPLPMLRSCDIVVRLTCLLGAIGLSLASGGVAQASCGDYLAGGVDHHRHGDNPPPLAPICNGPQCRQAPVLPAPPMPAPERSSADERICVAGETENLPFENRALRFLFDERLTPAPAPSGPLRPPRG
jgi:hypothetical protein